MLALQKAVQSTWYTAMPVVTAHRAMQVLRHSPTYESNRMSKNTLSWTIGREQVMQHPQPSYPQADAVKGNVLEAPMTERSSDVQLDMQDAPEKCTPSAGAAGEAHVHAAMGRQQRTGALPLGGHPRPCQGRLQVRQLHDACIARTPSLHGALQARTSGGLHLYHGAKQQPRSPNRAKRPNGQANTTLRSLITAAAVPKHFRQRQL